MTVAFAYDFGPGAGFGHQRRCAVIANALTDLNVRTREVQIEGAFAVEASVIFVDSYRTRADDQAIYRAANVVAVDDLARDLEVSMVIDPAPGATSAVHARATHALAGAQYALVDPALKSLETSDVSIAPKSVLVTTGASDDAGVGAQMATRIAEAFPLLTVNLVVGPWGTRTVPPGVGLLERANGLGADLARTDIVVTAGGVALLEALCLGRPTVAVPIAVNQQANVAGVVARGAALTSDPIHICETVQRLVGSAVLRAQISESAMGLIDGQGANRVARRIVNVCSELAI